MVVQHLESSCSNSSEVFSLTNQKPLWVNLDWYGMTVTMFLSDNEADAWHILELTRWPTYFLIGHVL